ncbi:MAG: DUF615 domain-containing protein [Betaproteobacteria bacterium]|nr:DUF615 domain-containing protein [Betaproteobacteria bacterium]
MHRYPNLNHRTPESDALADSSPPSKTRRKEAMHALQDLGEALVLVSPERLAQIELPERLRDAIVEARRITRHEARRRQMQYLGRLMRDVDPEPIRAKLDEWEQGPRREKAQLHRLEAWRDRLLAEPAALDELALSVPELDRAHFQRLIRMALDERAKDQPPRYYRQLFQELKPLLAPST